MLIPKAGIWLYIVPTIGEIVNNGFPIIGDNSQFTAKYGNSHYRGNFLTFGSRAWFLN